MSCDAPPYLHRELARTGAVWRLRMAADVVDKPDGLRHPQLADGLRDTAILIEKQIAQQTPASAARAGITESEIENAVRDAMNAQPMGTFAQIIDRAVRKLALDNVQLRSAVAAEMRNADLADGNHDQALAELEALRGKLDAAASQRCADSVDRVDAQQRAMKALEELYRARQEISALKSERDALAKREHVMRVERENQVGELRDQMRSQERLIALLRIQSAQPAEPHAPNPRMSQLERALLSFVDQHRCRLDHNGFCQEHGCASPCRVTVARDLLKLPSPSPVDMR